MKEDQECKGLFFRCRVNDYSSGSNTAPVYNPALHHNVSFTLLKRLSCKDLETCPHCVQFFEDLSSDGTEAVVWPEKPNDHTIYEAQYRHERVGSYDDEYDDYHWELVPVKGA